jgi:hypothetical protein
MTDIHPAFAAADRLAPVPNQDSTIDDWVRHYAALALAAWTVFERETSNLPPHPVEGSRPDIGYLATIGVTATSAAIALTNSQQYVARLLYDLTREAGALNGEWEEWLADTLDELGINPADINPEYVAGDFRSPFTTEEATR